MKKLIALVLTVVAVVTMLVTSIAAVNIEDDNGDIVGTSTLTHSNYVYTLDVRSTRSSGSVYGRIYLYNANKGTIDGGWDSGTGSMSITHGKSGVKPYYKSIWSKAQGIQYTYYDEY